jgi:hydroxyacylglutathione hydrolase
VNRSQAAVRRQSDGAALRIQARLASLPEDDGTSRPEDVDRALANGERLLLLDVRSLEETEARGYFQSTPQLRIPVEAFVAQRGSLPKDKSTRIVTYCGTGHRCLLAMMMLRSSGYTDVRNLVGGLQAWQGEGLPVAKIGSP